MEREQETAKTLTQNKVHKSPREVDDTADEIGSDGGDGVEGGEDGVEDGAEDVEDGADEGGEGVVYAGHCDGFKFIVALLWVESKLRELKRSVMAA